MKKLERVHNVLEAKVLIKEAVKRFDEEKYFGTEWETHDGEYLFHTEEAKGDKQGDDGLVMVNKKEVIQ